MRTMKCVMRSESDNINIMMNYKVDEVKLGKNNFSIRKNDWKKLRKIAKQMLFIFCLLKKK